MSVRKEWVDRGDELPIVWQCQLAGVTRSVVYAQPAGVSKNDLEILDLIDKEYTRHPFYGM